MRVEVAVLGSPSQISLMVFLDVKQHFKNSPENPIFREMYKVRPESDTWYSGDLKSGRLCSQSQN